MNKIKPDKTRLARTIYTILLSITGALVALFIIGTIAGLTRKSDTPLFSLGNPSGVQTQAVSASLQEGDLRVFSGIGRLRISLVNSGVLILSIAFPYQASDIAFTEELAGKINEFKTIASDYFSSLPESEIIQINEDKAKQEILSRYNSILRLGRISTLYFNDMMLLDMIQN